MENQDKKTLYFYGVKKVEWKGITHSRRVTFAGVIEGDVIRIATSACSEKDRFVKLKGRNIATGRAFKKPEYLYKVTGVLTPALQFIEFCKKTLTEQTKQKEPVIA